MYIAMDLVYVLTLEDLRLTFNKYVRNRKRFPTKPPAFDFHQL